MNSEIFNYENSAATSKRIIEIMETIPGTEARKCAPEELKRELQQGDWVLYKGKPRRVYKFMPFGPTEEFPAIVRDPRFDKVELVEIKRPVYVRDVQRMTVEAF